ncbi:hypothetical protein ABH994_005627 [Bradyrhizobium yuanmingense]
MRLSRVSVSGLSNRARGEYFLARVSSLFGDPARSRLGREGLRGTGRASKAALVMARLPRGHERLRWPFDLGKRSTLASGPLWGLDAENIAIRSCAAFSWPGEFADELETIGLRRAAASDKAHKPLLAHLQDQPFCGAPCPLPLSTKPGCCTLDSSLAARRADRVKSPYGQTLCADLASSQDGLAAEGARAMTRSLRAHHQL